MNTYVLHLSEAIYEELRKNKSNVSISVLCPGPVRTEFNKVAKVKFNLKSLESYDVAEYALKKTFKKKLVIIPGIGIKLGTFANRLLPRKLMLRIIYKIQQKKA